jgi:SET domain-containing protein
MTTSTPTHETTSTADKPILVRRSRIHGRGVYATRPIAEGDRIIEYVGERISSEQADAECADDEAMARHHTFFFAVDDDTVIDGGRGGNESRFINHSCDPNCEVVVERKRIFIQALRDIQPGEELFYDYWYTTDDSYTEADLRRIYPCRCGAATCRGYLARPPRRRATGAAKRRAKKKSGRRTA